jgi:hypothetical protein
MVALKKFFIDYRTRSESKKKIEKPYTYFDQAKQIGILFTVVDKEKHDLIKDFIKQLESAGKKVTVLTFLPKKKENFEFKFDYVTEKDFSYSGKLNSDEGLKFVKQNFDFLFYLDLEPNLYTINILSSCSAKCRAGKYQDQKSGLLEFMLKSNEKIDLKTLINQLYHYITLAKSN